MASQGGGFGQGNSASYMPQYRGWQQPGMGSMFGSRGGYAGNGMRKPITDPSMGQAPDGGMGPVGSVGGGGYNGGGINPGGMYTGGPMASSRGPWDMNRANEQPVTGGLSPREQQGMPGWATPEQMQVRGTAGSVDPIASQNAAYANTYGNPTGALRDAYATRYGNMLQESNGINGFMEDRQALGLGSGDISRMSQQAAGGQIQRRDMTGQQAQMLQSDSQRRNYERLRALGWKV